MRKALTLTLLAAAGLAGCGGDGGDAGLRGRTAASAPSVLARSGLAAALDERAWLTAFAAGTSTAKGTASAGTLAAVRTVDLGSSAVASELGAALGDRTGRRALAVLRRQDELADELAVAGRRRDARAQAAARAALAATRGGLTHLLATDAETRRTLRRDLAGATTRLAAAVDAVATGRADAAPRTLVAAGRAARPAEALALAADERRDPPAAGSAASPAAELGALAATTFTDAAYAQAATTAAGPAPGPRRRAARRTLEDTTDALQQLVASVYGEDAGERFAALWAARGDALRDYAAAERADDGRATDRALATLSRWRAQTADLLGELDPNGRRPGLARALSRDGDTATAAVRADLARSPKLGPRLLDAATATRAIGRAFVVDAVRRFPAKFPG